MTSHLDNLSSSLPALPTPVMAASDVLILDDKRSPAGHRSSTMLSPPPSPFASTDGPSTRADPPLFAASSHDSSSSSDLRAAAMFRPLVDVVRQNNAAAASAVAKPDKKDTSDKKNDSEYFQSTVYEQYSKSPRRWLAAQREMLKLYKPQIATVISVTATHPLPSPAAAAAAPARPARVVKPRHVQSPSGGVSTRNSAPSSPRSKKVRPTTVSPTAFTLPISSKRLPSSPESSPRTSTVHDIDLDDVPDFCPPQSSLDGTKGMRTDWKGNAMDLSDDPDRHLVHPYELQLASVLRLPCAMYLDSKKRIFAERVFRARKGLLFRRTDSQKACRIDVNKATRLFVAFEKVGWFDDKWLAPYL